MRARAAILTITAALAVALAPSAHAGEPTPQQQRCLDVYTAATRTDQARLDAVTAEADKARKATVRAARAAWEDTGRDPMARESLDEAIDDAWTRYAETTSAADEQFARTTRVPARTLQVCLSSAARGKPDRLPARTLSDPRATVSALASFVAAHVAGGGIDPITGTVVGDGRSVIWGSPFDGLVVPEGYTVSWDYDMGSFCVSGHGYWLTDWTGGAKPGTCPTSQP